MSIHKPSSIWGLSKDSKSYVRTTKDKAIQVVLAARGDVTFDDANGLFGFVMTRGQARLLADRLRRCLEDTK
jgi:hypothetical protein